MEQFNTRPIKEFHVSRKTRDKYHFSDPLFSISGNVIFTNYLAARSFAQKINQKRDLINYPEQAIRPSQLIAMGLIDEILHYVVGVYMEDMVPAAMKDALSNLGDLPGKDRVEQTFFAFTDEFPPLRVYKEGIGNEAYLNGTTEGVPNREITLEEILLLWLANQNPAFSPFLELIDDAVLRKDSSYLQIIAELHRFFDKYPRFGPEHQNLIDMLRAPAVAVPHSLSGQLEYIMEHWGYLLGKYFRRLLRSLDLFKEEEKMPFLGPGPAQIYRFTGLEFEPERFSPDRDWMPRLVLIAKNIYVWLDQLSRLHGRHLSNLNDIPDEELDILRNRGINGLWLIGVWERSPASQKIKQLCGNPEAVPSAYSLFDYNISGDLGGEEAFQNLKERAWSRGIRLASDMVPNHVGIYSRWVVEHPDWFISLDHNPFPWYSFNGMDLSHDERVSIQIEDHYYERTDAAVVFKRRDRWTGSEQFVYHGNDGTSMPWNDTAQLNYLNPEMREAMIRTIIHVAKQFPVIRFDAAMTLTKKHYQRLWFPEAGTGGAIPTRGEHGINKERFDELMPQEFWREVVDRIAVEAPDTLLLAEAFWLLEGYFVRTLGMHRVYNSAFMNMLRDEENAKYRMVIKNTLEFDPEILKRFVNFMNNPDERTAVDQFGKDNKYFGVCTVMITMPGLPMFGHGQIEGFAEKYGMEYRRAYWDETTDGYLVERHDREIFPLLHKRYLFAGVENFLLYDFFTPDGHVDENIFAYSNRHGYERSLVVFNNSTNNVRGWIRMSVSFAVGSGGGAGKHLMQKTLSEGLSIKPDDGCFTIFRDHMSGLEYIRNSTGLVEKGLYVELGSYHYHVFLYFREVRDSYERQYTQICEYLNGRGTPSIEESMQELFLQPIHNALRGLINPDTLGKLVSAAAIPSGEVPLDHSALIKELTGERTLFLLREIKRFASAPADELRLSDNIQKKLAKAFTIPMLYEPEAAETEKMIFSCTPAAPHFCWLFIHSLGEIMDAGIDASEQSRGFIDEWLLDRILIDAFKTLGLSATETWEAVRLISIFTTHQHWLNEQDTTKCGNRRVLESFLNDNEVQQLLQINRYQDILWFSKEAFETFLSWMFFTGYISLASKADTEESGDRNRIVKKMHSVVRRIYHASLESGYRVDRLMELSKNPEDTSEHDNQ